MLPILTLYNTQEYDSDTLQWLVLAAGCGHDTVGTRGHNEALATVTPGPRYTVTPDPHYTYHLAQGPHAQCLYSVCTCNRAT